ncbi:hypothetical protein PRIPAC_81906 [Pristionchus pacificus]|uniref:Cytochrome P450 n=1 Tax=Pristionchus pacificus TaxID=54126 RepID=A0A2A6C4A8_PRIPA|nr:hypothetical protein PRIPAC_81906 [Pristionchus pacificus]|eukprot:PDM72960.1 cytochrome P450 [Pristionchus pacificus]
MHVGLKRLTSRFGSIFTVHLPYPVVNIVDFETMKEAFRGANLRGKYTNNITSFNDVSGRMPNLLVDLTRMCENGGSSRFHHGHIGLMEFVEDQVKSAKFDPSEEPTCCVQAFLKSSKDKRLEQLLTCCSDLFIACQETTTTTMRWAMLLMASHPQVQEKFRREINAHIERDRVARMADKATMPYASAAVHEIQRYANIVAPNPLLFHRTKVDTVIGGHKIAANTIVNGDIHQMMKSDSTASILAREIYIAEDGVTLKKNFRILPLPGATIDLEPIITNVHFPRPQNFRLEII